MNENQNHEGIGAYGIPQVSVGQQTLKCLKCIGEFNIARRSGISIEQRPAINDAVTLAPSWVSQTIGGQMVMACVALPSCMDHLETKQKSAAERAASSGLVLGGG